MGTRSVRITWAGESRPVYLALQNSLFEVCVGEGGVDDDVGMDVSALWWGSSLRSSEVATTSSAREMP